ncbi:MAG: response regulator [Acidobacteriota bacterium]
MANPAARQCHVLVVEDERHIARLLDHVLRKEGYAVTAVHDAEKALASIALRAPDAILLDIVLPGMSGLDLLRQIRQDARWAELVVIVLSGHWFKHDDPTLADAGATAQCPKPIAPSKLIRKLHECGMTPWLTPAPVGADSTVS